MREIGTIPRWKWGLVAALAIVAAVIWVGGLSSRRPSGSLSDSALVAVNLKGIGNALGLYVHTHGGQDPPHLAALVKENLLATSLFVYRASGVERSQTDEPDDIDAHNAYVVVLGFSPHTPDYMIRGFSMPAYHHHEGLCVLYAGIHVEFEQDPRPFMAQLQRTNEYLAERRAGNER